MTWLKVLLKSMLKFDRHLNSTWTSWIELFNQLNNFNYELFEQNKDFPFLYLGHKNDHLIYAICLLHSTKYLLTYYAIVLYFKRQVFFLWTCRTGKRLQGIHKYANQQTKKVRSSSALKSRLFFGRQRKAYSKTWNWFSYIFKRTRSIKSCQFF